MILNGSHIDKESLLHVYTSKMLAQRLKLEEYFVKNLYQTEFFEVFRSRYVQNSYVEVYIIGWDIATVHTKKTHLHTSTNLGEFLSFFKIKLCSFGDTICCTIPASVAFLQMLYSELPGNLNSSKLYPAKKVNPYLSRNISLA